jgi:hypothetical protein
MAPIQHRDTIVKKIIRTALGDQVLEDEELLERAQMCAAAAMSIISAIGDDDVFDEAIATLSADDQTVQCEIRANGCSTTDRACIA